MPAPPPDNPEVAKVTLVFSRDQRTFMNVFHVDFVSAVTFPQLVVLCNDFATWWADFYSDGVHSSVSLIQVQGRALNPDIPLAFDLAVDPPIPGARGANPSPGNVTSTISWRTGLAGRRFRGRNYVPTISEDDTSSLDLISSTLVNILASAAIELISNALTEGVLGIFHAPGEVPNTHDNTITDVVSAVIENIVDSQRRRLPGRGV